MSQYDKHALNRFLEKIRINPTTECWEWTGAQSKGYGWFYFGGGRNNQVQGGAHRFSFEYYVGPLENKKHIDHKCSNTLCVNPEHLQQVSACENVNLAVERKENPRSAKTHCKRGHEFNEENTYYYNNWSGIARLCRECKKFRRRNKK